MLRWMQEILSSHKAETSPSQKVRDRESARYYDELEKNEGIPPAAERVELLSIWVAECFPSSQIDALLTAFRSLGWSERDPYHDMEYRLSNWIQERRRAPLGGGWVSLNLITRETDSRWWSPEKYTANLPGNCDYANAALSCISAGLFIFTMQFVLDPFPSQRLTDALRAQYTTRVRSEGSTTSYYTPSMEKRAATQAIRTETRSACIGWMRANLPGMFASEGDNSAYPTAEVLTLRIGQPFVRTERSHWNDYQSMLNLDNSFDVWEDLSDFPGLRLALPRGTENDRFHLVLAGNIIDIRTSGEWGGYSGNYRQAVTVRLSHWAETLSRWTLHAMLHHYEQRYTVLEASLSRALNQQTRTTLPTAVINLESELLKMSSDAIIVASRLEEFCRSRAWFMSNVGEYSRVEHRPKETEENLFNGLRQGLLRRSQRLRQTDANTRQLAQAASAAANARSQAQLARSNRTLAFVVGVIAFLQLLVALITYYHMRH